MSTLLIIAIFVVTIIVMAYVSWFYKEFKKYYEKLNEAQGWIPSKKRLPTRNDSDSVSQVLVWNRALGWVETADWQYVAKRPSNFTHWQRLPIAPEKGE